MFCEIKKSSGKISVKAHKGKSVPEDEVMGYMGWEGAFCATTTEMFEGTVKEST